MISSILDRFCRRQNRPVTAIHGNRFKGGGDSPEEQTYTNGCDIGFVLPADFRRGDRLYVAIC